MSLAGLTLMFGLYGMKFATDSLVRLGGSAANCLFRAAVNLPYLEVDLRGRPGPDFDR